MKKRLLLLLVPLFMVSLGLSAQNFAVKGNVKDSTGEPVIGASIKVVEHPNLGVITDFDGNFSISVPNDTKELEISYVGMGTKRVAIRKGAPVNVVLDEDAEALDEVVVTALGIKREKKALGYAMEEVKGDIILEARENNVANALQGKVAGLQITRSGNGPGASSKIVLRGNNSITGLNQPLIVVDGVPMDNFTGASNNDFWNPSADMGNGLSDINPDDIESMSVLKGASAAALYGSRAGNGVILITTKKGAQNKGLGLTISGTAQMETLFMAPDRQTTFGQGTLGEYNAGAGGSWGPKIEGQSYTRWDETTANMKYYDNLNSYFGTGTELQENVTLSQQYGNTSLYVSGTNLDTKSMTPGAALSRTNLTMRGVTQFGKDNRWTFDGKVQYIKAKANNRPISGKNDRNSALGMYTFPTSLDIAEFADYVDDAGNMTWWNASGYNPYWMAYLNQNMDERDRFLMTASLKYQITDWLSAEIKGGTDMYTNETSSRVYAGNPNLNTSYAFGMNKFFENNYSFLLTAQKDHVFGNWGGAATFGGNLMETMRSGLSSSTSNLVVPNKFSVNNGNSTPSVSETSPAHKKINSLYGSAQVNYDGWFFLEGTLRNDWTSTLSAANRSYMYPSVSTSYVFTDMIEKTGGNLPSWLTFGKVRASYAEVGNDMSPYQLYNQFSTGSTSHAGMTASTGSTMYDENVKNELIKSWEAGIEMRFFNNRLGFDFAWYKSNATDQLLNIPVNALSGYSHKKINAGDIQNQGVEFTLNATPVQTKDFEWTINANISHNENKIIDLYKDIEYYSLGGYDNLSVYAVKGGNYGEIWGTKFKTVTDEESPYFGKKILTSDGLPQGDGTKVKIGDQQAKLVAGLTNTFTYKGWTLSALIDGRFGGQIFSGTLREMELAGTAACTAPNGEREEMVLDGVIATEDGYVENTNSITQEKYWAAIAGSTGNLGIGEANLYDATNIRLRNLSLAYKFPAKMLRNTCFQSIKAGFTVTNVCMLYSKMNGLDPESVFATSTNATGFEYAGLPTTRNYIFNISLGF